MTNTIDFFKIYNSYEYTVIKTKGKIEIYDSFFYSLGGTFGGPVLTIFKNCDVTIGYKNDIYKIQEIEVDKVIYKMLSQGISNYYEIKQSSIKKIKKQKRENYSDTIVLNGKEWVLCDTYHCSEISSGQNLHKYKDETN